MKSKERKCPMRPPKESPYSLACEECAWATECEESCLLKVLRERMSKRKERYYVGREGEYDGR